MEGEKHYILAADKSIVINDTNLNASNEGEASGTVDKVAYVSAKPKCGIRRIPGPPADDSASSSDDEDDVTRKIKDEPDRSEKNYTSSPTCANVSMFSPSNRSYDRTRSVTAIIKAFSGQPRIFRLYDDDLENGAEIYAHIADMSDATPRDKCKSIFWMLNGSPHSLFTGRGRGSPTFEE